MFVLHSNQFCEKLFVFTASVSIINIINTEIHWIVAS
jgi:hypothetical protein